MTRAASKVSSKAEFESLATATPGAPAEPKPQAKDETKPDARGGKTVDQARREYQSLADQCSAMAVRIRKAQPEIERRVKEQMGNLEQELEKLKQQKAQAARELEAAEARERPSREAREQQAEVDRLESERRKRADANAKRHAEQEKTQRRRMAEAVQ